MMSTLETSAPATEIVNVLTHLRCVTTPHLSALAYREPPPERTARSHVASLVELGALRRLDIDGVKSGALILTRTGMRQTPRARGLPSPHRAPPSPQTGFVLLQRASLWAALAEDGWTVGNGTRERLLLRRSLVDRQRAIVAASAGRAREATEAALKALRAHPHLTPPAEARCARECGWVSAVTATRRCAVCGAEAVPTVVLDPAVCACGSAFDLAHAASVLRHEAHGGWRLAPALPYDVAEKGGRLLLLLCDNPRASVTAQVGRLPLRTLGQPRLEVVLRPSDDNTVFDPVNGTYAMKGPRFRLLTSLFAKDHLAGHFPYATTADVVAFRPETQLRVLSTRRT